MGPIPLILLAIIGQVFSVPLVCLKEGQCILGSTIAATGTKAKKFDAFYGIPYAKPPVGDLRFADPQPADKWNGTLDATLEKPMCIQKNVLVPSPTVQGEEDCLYLNVYRPRSANGWLFKKSLPVMIFIHYGGLFAGAITPYLLGPEYFMDTGSVIMVMMQYRLGSLGFLSTGDSASPGNYGFKDQVMAMRWVKDNIECFGGDPTSVTLFGQSAGAVSTHMHMLSPLSKGLFHRAIVQSGNAIAPYNFPVDDPLQQAREQAKVLDIPNASTLDSAKIVDELRKVDAKRLVESSDKMKFFSVDPIVLFRTAIEPPGPTAFMSENPIDIVKSGKFQHVPWMTGLVPNEGIVRAAAILTNETDLKELNSRFDELMPKLMQINATAEELATFWPKARDFYFNGESYVNDSNAQRFIDIFTDRAFYHPFYKTVEAYLSYADTTKNPLHLYKLSYKGNYSYSVVYTGSTRDFGVVHCDDLLYLFRTPAVFPKGLPPDSSDEKMKNIFVKTFTSFATSGKPKEWTNVPDCNKASMNPICHYQHFNNSPTGDILVNSSQQFDMAPVRLWDELREY
ncbi:juvenile hormone esterase-like [Phlebotomus argentipes]|uniref:juvenile hormone esterase-like n=1 Tax=Phlebotomus argentipes TaxID=94469 RepID=UPI0028936C14|nr:juvenile hormone esterase-like [Phlebotomus argentipes]